jgi:hypothetical protein
MSIGAPQPCLALQLEDAVDLDRRTSRQRGDCDRGPRRVRLGHVLRHDAVDELEVPPAAAAMAFRFSKTRRTCASMSPDTSSPVAGSSGIWPDT